MAKVEAVLLDCDGTVVRMMYRYMDAKKDVISYLTQRGFPRDLFNPEDPAKKLFDKLRVYLNQTGRMLEFTGLKKSCEQILDRYELEAAEGTCLIDGVVNVLASLRQVGLKVALVTNNGAKATHRILERFRLHPFFAIVVTREDVAEMKPSPDPILLALEKLRVPPDKAVAVGDSVIDMEAARLAGVLAVGVKSGLRDEEALRSAGAVFVISSLTQLPALICQVDSATA